MKKLLLCVTIFSTAFSAHSQPLPDSVLAQYQTAKSDREKGSCLLNYFKKQSLSDTATKAHILSLKTWFEKQHDDAGKDYTNLNLARILINSGDYPAALDLLFSTLPQFENRNDSFGMQNTYAIIGDTYMDAKDYDQSAEYSKKVIAFAGSDKNLLARVYNDIACTYGEGKMADSGMLYAEKAVKMDMESKNFYQLALSTSTLGENYIAAGEYDIALPFLRRTASYYKENGAPSAYLNAYLKNDFAEVFFATKIYDSAMYYAKQALIVSGTNEVQNQRMRAYEYLYKCFEQTNQQDSLNKYFRLAMLTKDSLFNIEKVKSIQALSFREDMRQQEIAAEKQKLADERQHNIQYAALALGIIILVTIFLLLSQTVVVDEKTNYILCCTWFINRI